DLRAEIAGELGLEGRSERGRGAGVAAQRRYRLVRDELRLYDQPRRILERFDVVADRRDRPLHERDEPPRDDADPLSRRRAPVRLAAEHARSEVEHALMAEQVTEADVERLVIDEQPHDLAVGDVDDHLSGLGIAVSRFYVGERTLLVETVQIRAREPVRFALIEIPAQPDVAVRKREHRPRLREYVQVQLRLPQCPRLDREGRMLDHRSTSSARSETTRSAPC